jgi:hypothetical protein
MPLSIIGLNGHEVYAAVVAAVFNDEMYEIRSPRDQETRDLGHVTLRVIHPLEGMMPLGTRPGINTKIAAVEAAQLVGALVNNELMRRVAPALDKYRESNGQFWGAYGHRISNQVSKIVNKLTMDSSSRQAVITLWDPWYDNYIGKLDYPCTIALQFEIRNEQLCMNTVMRSNDIHLGLPLDLFQFGQLQMSIARALHREVGWYQHTVLSMHAYTRDLDALKRVDIRNASDDFQPCGFGRDGDDWLMIAERAYNIVNGKLSEREASHSELWYITRFVEAT